MIEQKKVNHLHSSRTDLERRGYIEHYDTSGTSKALKPNLELLHDKTAINRSLGAKMLVYRLYKHEVIEALLLQLDREKALYTRLEICNTLSHGDANCAKLMIKYLGKIGKNQYHCLPKKISKKKSFPLPRDIIARTLGRMDKTTTRILLNSLPTCSITQARELIDAIGYQYFHQKTNKRQIFNKLYSYYQDCDDDIIRWKIICVFGWLKPYSTDILQSIPDTEGILYEEAQKGLQNKN
ncbi:hypothetical protein LJC02_01340 [Breznakia sp. OttesenSCG-928-G09]|nr:hypothetical protein [Breznakia sp. OttesenSCG-928-G09]